MPLPRSIADEMTTDIVANISTYNGRETGLYPLHRRYEDDDVELSDYHKLTTRRYRENSISPGLSG